MWYEEPIERLGGETKASHHLSNEISRTDHNDQAGSMRERLTPKWMAEDSAIKDVFGSFI